MATTDLEKLVVQLSADIRKYEKSLARANGITNKQFNAIEGRARKMNTRLNNIGKSAAQGLIAPLSGLGAALGTAEIIRYADAWTLAGNKIAAAGQIAGVETRSLDDLTADANSARTGVEAYVDLYSRLIRTASGVAKSEQEVADVTNTLAKSFKAGGAATSEQYAAILQLSQGLSSGILAGDELRSVRENAPLLAKAIADSLGVTIGALKGLGAEGKITTDVVFKAILDGKKDIEAAFKTTQSTIKDALTRVNNEFTAYIGNADDSIGATDKLVEALTYLADNFKEVGDTVLQFVGVLIGALTGRALVGVAVGLGNAVVALGTFLTAMRTGTLVAAGFTAALGPIGLLAGAAAAAIFLFSDSFDGITGKLDDFDAGIKLNEESLIAARGASESYTKALRNQIAMQLQAAKAAATEANAQFMAASARRSDLQAATGIRLDPLVYFEEAADKAAARAEALVYKLETQLSEVDSNLISTDPGFGKGKGKGGGKGKGSGKAKGFDRDIERIRQRTLELQAETAAQAKLNPLINDFGYSVAKAGTAQDLLNEAKENGIKITPELAGQIDMLAGAYASAVAESGRLADSQAKIKESAEDMLNLQRELTSDIITGFRDGKDAAEIFSSALIKVSDKLIEIGVNAAFPSAGGGLFGGGGGGGGGGLFSSLLGGVGKIFGFDKGGYTGDGGKYEPAGVVHKGEYVMDKESVRRAGGPEALDAMRKGLKGYANGGSVGGVSMPSIAPRSVSASNDTVNIVLTDDSGRMADIANQQIKSSAGTIINLSVQQSVTAVNKNMPQLIGNAQKRNG